MRTNRLRFCLRLEPLEKRLALSVTAGLEGSTLVIRGDDSSEFASIDVDPQAKTVMVRGTNMATELFSLDSISGINVGMQGGNDFAQLGVRKTAAIDATFATLANMQFNVWGGDGNDRTMLDIRTDAVGKVFVDGGSGKDRADIKGWYPRDFVGYQVEDIAPHLGRLAEAQKRLLENGLPSMFSQVPYFPITSSVGARDAAIYSDVIDQFDVRYSHADRYQFNGGGFDDTRCNILAGDSMRAMDAPLPTKDDLGGVDGGGSMTAGASRLHTWLKGTAGQQAGWRQIDLSSQSDLNVLLSHVRAGKPALASDSGHIAVIRPDQDIWTLTPANVDQLLTAQAGARNFSRGTLSYGWGGDISSVRIFIHD